MKINSEELKQRAKQIRKAVIELWKETGEAHFGGSFSEIEIMLSLFDVVMKPEDKFILSKGHGCYPLYVLLRERGYNPRISGHPDIDEKNGIYATTGSLGHGLPIAAGMALARKKFLRKKGDIYVLISDGECQEGTVWESAMIAADYNLDNLVAIVDNNKIQALQRIEEVSPSSQNLKRKFQAFGWYASETDGHDFDELIYALKQRNHTKPRMIIASTVKGKGVSFMENDPKWHTRPLTPEELKQAYKELE